MAKTINPEVARLIIEQVIQEMIASNEAALNGQMANEASKRLGRKVELKEISRIRNRIGLGSFQLHIQNVASQVSKEIQSFDPLPLASRGSFLSISVLHARDGH